MEITNPILKQLYSFINSEMNYHTDDKELYNNLLKNIELLQFNLNNLLERDKWLSCLEQAGVDNWEGYGIAIDIQDGII